MASQNAVAAPARMLRAVSPRAMRRWRRDGQLVVTLGLLAPITIIAIGRETHAEVLVAAAIAAVGLQLVLGAVERRAPAGMRPVVEMLRTATTVALLGAAQLITGASGLLAIGYVPIVATATGRSLRRLGIVVGMSIAMHMLVEAYARADSGSPLDLSLRGLAFGLFLVVGATVMRMQLLRVDGMRQRLRESLRADRRRERQIGAVERIGRILANSGPTDRALGNVVSHLSEELGFRYVAIYIGDRQLVRLGAQRGYADLVDRFDGTRGVVGRVMRTGRTHSCPT